MVSLPTRCVESIALIIEIVVLKYISDKIIDYLMTHAHPQMRKNVRLQVFPQTHKFSYVVRHHTDPSPPRYRARSDPLVGARTQSS